MPLVVIKDIKYENVKDQLYNKSDSTSRRRKRVARGATGIESAIFFNDDKIEFLIPHNRTLENFYLNPICV